jgi:predicted site-specific integrase-resolvase
VNVLSANEAAARLGLARKTLLEGRWRRRVKLPCVKIGGRVRFLERDIVDLIERGRERFGAEKPCIPA